MTFTVKKYCVFLVLIGCWGLALSCSTLALDVDNEEIVVAKSTQSNDNQNSEPNEFPWAESEGVRNVLRRASQLANITWLPLNEVPGNAGPYTAGVEVLGIPYSSTKQINKYVGLDVTLHTFMTAVHNPRSVIYTENLSQAPYFGVNCACYYGTVCSSAVAYALNLDAPYVSASFPSLPTSHEVSLSDLALLKPGDVLQRQGHVFMIFRIHTNDDGEVTNVSYYEAASRYARISTVSADYFRQRIENEKYRAYRYDFIDDVDKYEQSPYVAVGNEPVVAVSYNESLCPNRGDESVYRTDESVTINVFDHTYSTLVLEREGSVERFDCYDDVKLDHLLPGLYRAFLYDGLHRSDTASFIVAEPIVSVENQGLLHVSYSCEQGVPVYCVLCTMTGGCKSLHILTDTEIKQGYADIEPVNYNNYYCKVVFKTPYGTVINEPVLVY